MARSEGTILASEEVISIAKYQFSRERLLDYGTNFDIIIIGVGGTGGYVVRDAARLAYSLRGQLQIGITLVDPDTVELRNILRQNFIEDDIGKNKAEALAERYSAAFGIPISFIKEKFIHSTRIQPVNRVPKVIIGCVDNNAARREIHNLLVNEGNYGNTVAWIDSGNETIGGQVIMGTYGVYCNSYLPFVTQEYPEIRDKTKDPVSTVSCAERAQTDIQNIFVNLTAANHILNFLNIIFNEKKTGIYGVEFNIFGATKPLMIKKLIGYSEIHRDQSILGIGRCVV